MKSAKIVAAVLLALPALVQAQLTYFPIATNGVAMSFAFDGANYLVGVEIPQTPTPTIGAQMISATGSKVGSLISTGRSGIAATVAFDGTNYLLIWEDDGLGTLTNGSYQVYGQFISPAGATVGSPFNISGTGVQFDGIKTMAFGGGKYLVTYTRLINPALGDHSTNRCIAGLLVNPDGTVGDEIRLSTGYGKASDVAFDGANFLVVWCEDQYDTEIRGRMVTPAGDIGPEISINASAAPSDNPKSVAFDGTNYMVVWNDEVATDEWDCFGQRISTIGSLVGGVITITVDPGPQMVTSVAFDGNNYMAAWIDMQNETNWDMYGQYIDPNGSLVGGKFAISTNALNQIGGVGFANGKYLALVNDGVEMGEGGISQVDAATGAFITPSSTPVDPLFSDDFNDNIKDPAKWGDDVFVDEGTNSLLTETNGRLEFSGGSAGSNSDGIIRPWIGSFGSYTQNWEAAVDVHLGNVPLPQYTDLSMFLAVVEYGDPEFVDHMSVELSMDNGHDSITRVYTVNSAYNNNELDLGKATTADQQGRLRLAFDASTKILTGSFNGIALGSMDVDDPATSWEMSNGSSFMVVVGGSLWGDGLIVNGSDVYADNFEMRTGDDLEYLLTVGNGSGSGNYTNGAGVSITAATAPSGQVFDHWAGATQYLANASSATTTVTMPAQAITVTAAYKLIGTGLGDDFNDNAKDTGKWGDDVVLSYMPNVNLQEINGRLEFTGSTPASNNYAYVVRPWISGMGSYTQSWETAVDVHAGAIALPQAGNSISILLSVAKAGDASFADRFSVELRLERNYDGDQQRGYRVSSYVDHAELPAVPNFGYRSTTDQQGRLRIAFDASTKRLTASYNGNLLGWVDVDQAGTDWGMTDGSGFGIALGGIMWGDDFTYGGHEIYADNFSTVGTVAPPADGDGNGLPDAWEQLYFGTTGVDPNAISANGFNTIQQAYIAGFSPIDPSASFGITGISGNQIQWDAVSNRVYTVYWTTNLLDGFQVLESNHTGGSFTDTLHGAAACGFYKIDVQLAP